MNQDHFKLGGTAQNQPDVLGKQRQALAREKAEERLEAPRPKRPRKRATASQAPAHAEVPAEVLAAATVPGVEAVTHAAHEATAAAEQAADAAARKLEEVAERTRRLADRAARSDERRPQTAQVAAHASQPHAGAAPDYDRSILGGVRALGVQLVEMGVGVVRRRWEAWIEKAKERLGAGTPQHA